MVDVLGIVVLIDSIASVGHLFCVGLAVEPIFTSSFKQARQFRSLRVQSRGAVSLLLFS